MTEPIENPSAEEIVIWQPIFASGAFNETWTLLDAADLTRGDEEQMLATALAQRCHWYALGTERNQAIADRQVSQVAAVLGYADLTRRFGARPLEIAIEYSLDPFVKGFACEAITPAAAIVDDVETFTEHLELARATLAEIEDDQDQEVLQGALAEMSEE